MKELIDQAEFHRKAHSADWKERTIAAEQLKINFKTFADRDEAWNDLNQLIHDENGSVRSAAVESLGDAFPHIPDKKRAWGVLHWITRDVRRGAASAMGAAYPYIPDKEQALHDLIRLAQDREKGVRIAANYSLGRVCLFRAAEAQNEEIFKIELEKALEFFEESAKDVAFFTPAQFCLSFYRSFYTIFFKNHEVETEIREYLADVKIRISDSENKEKLLETAERLANALWQVREVRDFDRIRSDFNDSRKYCESAADIIDTTRRIRRGL